MAFLLVLTLSDFAAAGSVQEPLHEAADVFEAVSSPVIRESAEDLGRKIYHEDGVGNAVRVIEETMRNA